MLKFNEKRDWKKSNKLKNKSALLIASILLVSLASFVYASIIWSDGTITSFTITDTNPVCDNAAFAWKWWEGEELKQNSSLDDCYRDNGWPSTTCCPEPNECNLDDPLSESFGHCTGISAPEICSDYNAERYGGDLSLAEAHCEGFNINVSKRSMELFTGIEGFCDNHRISDIINGESCWRFAFDCRCVWDSVKNVCGEQASYSNWTCFGDTEIKNIENCSVFTAQKKDDCENTGYVTYSWNALWTGNEADKPDWCADNERNIRCSAKLAFFTITSLIAAVILIILIYIWIKRRARLKKDLGEKRKNKAGKRKKKR